MSSIVAGPGTARHLADFGADVIKIEPPEGDPARRLGWADPESGDSYYWKLAGRGKQTRVLDLTRPEQRDELLDLVADADVLIENMRPGKLEALGLDPTTLHERNRSLVIVRITAFGQDGPYASRPGFATLAEAMSSYAAISGEADGKPLLPPVALTDELAAIAGAFATMTALWHARSSGEGQVVDVNLLDTIIQILGPLPSAWAHLGYEQPRLSGGIPYSVPRGTYRCRDGRYVAVSSSSDRLADRILGLLGLEDDDRFASFADRAANRDDLEAAMAAWFATRDAADALRQMEEVDAAVAPVYSMGELFADPHARARELFVDVDGICQQRPIARLSKTPAEPGPPGRALDADPDASWRTGQESSDQSGLGTSNPTGFPH